jgi:hypothetical protein
MSTTQTSTQTTIQSTDQLFVAAAIKAWDQWTSRLSQFIESLTDAEMYAPIAPGKNRAIYIVGHLLVVNDAIAPQLGLGQPLHAELNEAFLKQPDGAVAELPTPQFLKESWKALNTRLDALYRELTPAQWLERHALVSEEDFAKDPTRNRLSILHSRTSHNAYHLGQLRLITKSK